MKKLTRSDQILKLIVEHFIKTAEPVSSKTLIDVYGFEASSATIRNEMHVLEKLGYIEKMHSSSGRVPNSLGYKYYCENLRDERVDEELKYQLEQVLKDRTQSIEETIQASCEILSHMTSLVSVFLGPDEKVERLANVQLIKVGDKTLTAIFVTDSGYVENKTFIIEDNVSRDDIVNCVKLLNDRLVGTPVNELVEKMEAIKPLLSDYIVNHDVVYQALVQTFLRFASDRLSLYGRDELFNQPEFKNDIEKLQRVFELISNASTYKEISGKSLEDLTIAIGDLKDNPDLALISAQITIGENESPSTIALIGPKRMDYDRVMSALAYIAETLNEYFRKERGDNDE